MRLSADSEPATQLAQLPEWPEWLRKAKLSIITRHVTDVVQSDPHIGLVPTGTPKAGDVLLARVDSVGTNDWLERPDGRKATLFVGDEIVVAYGARYATSAYRGLVPDDLGPCDLLACGGMAGRAVDVHSAAGVPTRLTPIGLLADGGGHVLNTRDYASVALSSGQPAVRVGVVVVVGTSMDAGKTTTAGSLIRGLVRAGHRVAAAKVTGTGSGKDRWYLADSGAWPVLDVVDTGMPSTHQVSPDDLVAAYFGMLAALAETGPRLIIVEIADGLGQVETAHLLSDPVVRATLSGVVLAAGDALGALAGVSLLASWQLPVIAVSGLVTASPLAQGEAAVLVDVPVVSIPELSDPAIVTGLIAVDSEEAA